MILPFLMPSATMGRIVHTCLKQVCDAVHPIAAMATTISISNPNDGSCRILAVLYIDSGTSEGRTVCRGFIDSFRRNGLLQGLVPVTEGLRKLVNDNK